MGIDTDTRIFQCLLTTVVFYDMDQRHLAERYNLKPASFIEGLTRFWLAFDSFMRSTEELDKYLDEAMFLFIKVNILMLAAFCPP
ncbi:MAG: hypothetical protein AB8U44_02385 [Aaplasma endosymbiont of Hyalomma asiaticum]